MTFNITQKNGFEDLPLLAKTAESYEIWHNFLMDFPRLSKYTLGAKIDNIFTQVLELILFAKYSNKTTKATLINQAITKFDSLKFFLQIAWQIKALDNKKYIRLSEPLAEIGRMLGGWRKQAQKETPPNQSGGG